jgi:condensin complex subunit 2
VGQKEVLDADMKEQQPITPIGEAKQFDTVIQSLRQSYPQDKMSEISTSFCFICLLHLANEEGLSIETARFDGQEDLDVGCLGEAEDVEVGYETHRPKKNKKMGDGERRDRVVGELQALRVYKVSSGIRAGW